MKSEAERQPALMRLLDYLRPYRWQLCAVALCMIGGTICATRAVYYMKPIINDYVIPLIGQANPDYTGFYDMLALMALLYLSSVAASALHNILMIRISTDAMYRIRREMFHRMAHFPLAYFDTHSRGQLMSYYSADVDALSAMLSRGLPKLVEGFTMIATILVTIFAIDWRMALVVTGCAAAIALVLRRLSRNKSGYFTAQQQSIQDLNAYGEEMVAGRVEIKAFAREEAAQKEFEARSHRLFHHSSMADFFANSLFDFTAGLDNLGFAAVAVCGCLLSLEDQSDPGTVIVFLQYYKSMMTPLTRIAKQVNNVMEAMAGANRIFAFLDTPAEPDWGQVQLISCAREPDLHESPAPAYEYVWQLPDGERRPCLGALEFDGVEFAYTPGVPVLRGLSFRVEPGQTVAFVGATGAGKTTVVNLLSRFYEISAGSITFDGIDIRQIRKKDLRRAVSVVLQEVHLFTASVAENIKYGAPEATAAEVQAAARAANADYFISHLKDLYATILHHGGAALSEGERQLLAVARAEASQKPVLVLDEATSSIDSLTEMRVTKGLDTLMQGKTVLVIAHRLSTIRKADLIIVLEQGRMAEMGSHAELMERKGLYYHLYTKAG